MRLEPEHYLKITPAGPSQWWWECICGKAKGRGPTELACEFSFERHMVAVEFAQRRGKL